MTFGSRPSEGTVEVCTSGFWSTVCSSNWDSREAGIVCRQLGFHSIGIILHKYNIIIQFNSNLDLKLHTGAIPIFSATHVYGSNMDRPIILSGFHCSGRERNLLGCSRYSVNSIDCSHYSDVGVQCPGVCIYIT